MANPYAGKASSDRPALKPYRGKPAVRNFRGGDGNVGIIRSPIRAIALPDHFSTSMEARRVIGQTFDEEPGRHLLTARENSPSYITQGREVL